MKTYDTKTFTTEKNKGQLIYENIKTINQY